MLAGGRNVTGQGLTLDPLCALGTPCLLLDARRMDRNIERMRHRSEALGVVLRSHLKTCKSVPVARRMVPGLRGPVTVSTLQEAEAFAAAGARDILYAVGIAPDKLPRVARLRRTGVDLSLLLDSPAQAEAVAACSRDSGDPIPVLIEIDSDGHRGGVAPDDAGRLLSVARAALRGAELRGVLTHAGESYFARTPEQLLRFAEIERDGVVRAAATLRAAGFDCPVVSVGSTPTATAARDLTGVTELRAGVYVFFDLVMAGIGVCSIDDIALSVLATVIGHRPDRGWILVDAGWMAMSRDRGTQKQPLDQGYGLVCDTALQPYPGLIMTQANQEHGILSLRPGSDARLPDLPVGARVRILPNHACATAAQHGGYHVVRDSGRIHDFWQRRGGW